MAKLQGKLNKALGASEAVETKRLRRKGKKLEHTILLIEQSKEKDWDDEVSEL